MTDPGDGRPLAVILRVEDGALRHRLRGIMLEQDGLDLLPDDGQAGPEAIVVTDGEDALDGRPAVLVVPGPLPARLPRGVRAVLAADAGAALLVAVLRVAAAGFRVLPDEAPEPERSFADGLEEPAGLDDRAAPSLTQREQQVMALLAGGASNKVIARRLGISVHTAKFHVASITDKLGARGRLDAVGIALRRGMVLL